MIHLPPEPCEMRRCLQRKNAEQTALHASDIELLANMSGAFLLVHMPSVRGSGTRKTGKRFL